jgi:hypothetical protein
VHEKEKTPFTRFVRAGLVSLKFSQDSVMIAKPGKRTRCIRLVACRTGHYMIDCQLSVPRSHGDQRT